MSPVFFLVPEVQRKKQKEQGAQWRRYSNEFVTLVRVDVKFCEAKHREKWNDQGGERKEFNGCIEGID